MAFISAGFVALGAAAATKTPSAPSMVINVSAPSASAPSIGSLLVTVDGLTNEETMNAGLLSAPKDIQEASAVASVSFGEPVALVPGSSQRRWMLPFRVTGLPAGTTQTRYLAFKVGAVDWALPYQIASPASPTVSWSLKPPPAASRALGAGEGIPINIAVNGNTPVAGLHLTPLDLIEKATGRPLANVKWGLCKLGDKCTITTIPSLEVGPHDYWIMPTGDVPPGKYEGTITVASTDKPTGESVGVTLNFSSSQDKFYGFLAILAGLSLGFYVTTFLRRRTDRDQLLIGPAMLRAESDRLRLVLHADSLAKTPEINAQLDALEEALSESRLELAGLPPKIPIPWPANIDRYKTYVDGQTAVLNALRAIVNAGILPLLAARHDDEARDGPLNANETGAFDKAMDGIDQIAHWTAPPDPATVPATATPYIQAFKDAVEKSRAKNKVRLAFAAGAAPSARVARLPSPEQLRIRINEGSLLAWGILGIVTTITGAYVLIFSNQGFGTCLDIVGCLLWGAGLPAGSALAGSTTGTVSTALNITR